MEDQFPLELCDCRVERYAVFRDLNPRMEGSGGRCQHLFRKIVGFNNAFPLEDGIKEALNHYLNMIFVREEQIFSHLQKRMTLEELGKKNIIYRKDQKKYESFAWFEKNMIEKHLRRLIEQGKVERVKDGYKAL